MVSTQDEKVFKNCVTVRYSETDRSGIVSVQHYLTWLDTARDRFFEYMGIPYNCSFEAKGYLLMLADYLIDFNRQVNAFEDIEIYSSVTHLEPKRVIITHRVFLKGDEEAHAVPVCEAHAKLAFVSMKTHRSVTFDQEEPAVFNRLCEFLQEGHSF